jgi:hypothetical protein
MTSLLTEPKNRLYMLCFTNAAVGQEIGLAVQNEFTGYVPV